MLFISSYRKMNTKHYQLFFSVRQYSKWFIALLGLIFVIHGYADGGTDLMAGTTGDASSTFFGSGKFYIYLAELVVGVCGYITTRSMKVFFGIVIVAFIFTSIAPHFLNSTSV